MKLDAPENMRYFIATLYSCFLQVFLEYSDTSSCANARNALNGRKFGGNTVNASYYPEDKYNNGDYGF
jgi:hypothetical protein